MRRQTNYLSYKTFSCWCNSTDESKLIIIWIFCCLIISLPVQCCRVFIMYFLQFCHKSNNFLLRSMQCFTFVICFQMPTHTRIIWIVPWYKVCSLKIMKLLSTLLIFYFFFIIQDTLHICILCKNKEKKNYNFKRKKKS